MKTASEYESLGAYFGIAGATVLALSIPASRWGWILFLVSNIFWLLFALHFDFRKLALQTLAFTASSALGIANSFFPGNALQTWLTHLVAGIS